MADLLPQAFRIHSVSHLHLRADWKLREHAHEGFNEMILVLGGRIETRIRGKTLQGETGSVLIYPRGVPHEERAVDGPLHLLLVVWKEKSPAWPPSDLPIMSLDGRGRIQQILHWLHELHPAGQLILSSLLHCALFEFAHGAAVLRDDPIDRVRHYITLNFGQKMNLATLAKIACQSPYHFSRLFRERTGLPPMRYLRQVRVEAAKAMLVASPMPLRAIAPMVGLMDEFHLSRVFRSMTGHAPSTLRRRPRSP